MAWPGTPLWLLCVLLFATQLIAVPFGAARAALLPDVLPGDLYVLGNAVGNITNQLGQVIGFAAGGLLVGVLGSSPTLALDAATFLVSAALLRSGVRHRPAARSSECASEPLLVAAAAGVRLVWGSRDLRVLAGFGWLGAFYVVPELRGSLRRPARFGTRGCRQPARSGSVRDRGGRAGVKAGCCTPRSDSD